MSENGDGIEPGGQPAEPSPGPLSQAPGSAPSTVYDPEAVRKKAEDLQRSVDDAIKFNLGPEGLVYLLRSKGATTAEGDDYFQQYRSRMGDRLRFSDDPPSINPGRHLPDTPRSIAPAPAVEQGEQAASEPSVPAMSAADAATEAEWAVLRAKAAHARSGASAPDHLNPVDLLKILGSTPDTTPRTIPSTVFTAAPHLQTLASKVVQDVHLDETYRLRGVYAGKDVIDSIIDLMQAQQVDQPLPRSIWKTIAQDHYVDFEKLNAAFDFGYDHNDEPKEIGGDLVLVKKDHSTAKKPLRSESDWNRVFSAWKEGTLLLYPHRHDELSAYTKIVAEMFQVAPNDPTFGIRFDAECRSRYHNSPYHLDDRSRSFVSILGQIVRANKRGPEGSSSSASKAKKPAAICHNWNLGICHDPCSSRRKHGFCSECGEKHRAKEDPTHISPAALSTETAPPLPSPPPHLLNDPIIQSTLQAMQSYINVSTPFNIDRFENILHDHPNRPFVDSVIRGLREGFWPFEDGDWNTTPEGISANFATEDIDLAAICQHRDKELGAGRWSPPLPIVSLLPGMKSSPMFVVWRKGKARVITDHSASGLNDGIPREEARVRYDDMRSFGQALYNARQQNPDRKLVVWKSDVSSAFLNLPAHPLWQLRQVVVIDGKLYIVRRLVFGNRASPRIWCSVSALLCWIGIKKLGMEGLNVYMDDFFDWDFADNFIRWHGIPRPRRQVQFLILWDFCFIPYDDPKQNHGSQLEVIGLWTDIDVGSISLAPEKIVDLIDHIKEFLSHPERHPQLRDWQRLGGHLNWLLNVLPWGRPALCEMYRKTSGKSGALSPVFVNREVEEDLLWLVGVINRAVGIRFVDSLLWSEDEADIVLWTDASLKHGLGFYYAGSGFAYRLNYPAQRRKEDPVLDIFFLELIAIMAAVHHVASFKQPPRRVLLYTDSLDAVGLLSSLSAATSMHNTALRGIAEVILVTGIDLRVQHISGKDNRRADLLSRLMFDEYHRLFPADRVYKFQPPRELLSARWRRSF